MRSLADCFREMHQIRLRISAIHRTYAEMAALECEAEEKKLALLEAERNNHPLWVRNIR